MILLFIAVSSFVIALSGALVPGPLFTVTVSESLKRGVSAGPLIILGHGILEISIVLLIIFGVTPYLSAQGTKTFISVTGGVVLVIMGIMLLKDAGGMRLKISPEERKGGLHPVLTGILGSLSNPYWVIWWVTIGLGYLVSAMKYGVPGVVAFFVGHISADLIWYSLISLAVAKGSRLIGERGYRFLLYACGLFLIFFGGWFISAA